MAEFKKHGPGTFCYVELATTDPDAAGEFYREMFGWMRSDMDMGEQGTYTQFVRGEKVTGAMHRLTPDQVGAQVPPHWGQYIAVQDVDAVTEKAKALGGNVLFGPFDVAEAGRMAVLQDPQGATFSVWQANEHPGIHLRNENDTLCWSELMTPDTDAATAFYGGLFGWEPQTSDTEGMRHYTSFHTGGGQAAAGMLAITEEMGPMPPNWMAYFQVADCSAYEAKAQGLGAQPIVPTTEIPGVGKFAVIHDPQGAVLGLFEPLSS